MRQLSALILAAAALLALTGCNREPKFWKDAEREQSVEAYETYLRECPTGQNAGTARSCLEKLLWERTVAENTEAAYAAFIARFPTSAHLAEARNAEAAAAWAAADSAGTVEAVNAFRAKYPGSAFDAQASGRLASADGGKWWAGLSARAAKTASAPRTASFALRAPDGAPVTAQVVSSANYPAGTTLEVTLSGPNGFAKTLHYRLVQTVGLSPVFLSEESGPAIVIGGQILIPLPTKAEAFRDNTADPIYQWKIAILAQTDSEMRTAPYSVRGLHRRHRAHSRAGRPLPDGERRFQGARRRRRDSRRPGQGRRGVERQQCGFPALSAFRLKAV